MLGATPARNSGLHNSNFVVNCCWTPSCLITDKAFQCLHYYQVLNSNLSNFVINYCWISLPVLPVISSHNQIYWKDTTAYEKQLFTVSEDSFIKMFQAVEQYRIKCVALEMSQSATHFIQNEVVRCLQHFQLLFCYAKSRTKWFNRLASKIENIKVEMLKIDIWREGGTCLKRDLYSLHPISL